MAVRLNHRIHAAEGQKTSAAFLCVLAAQKLGKREAEEEIMADMENWEELSQQLEELEGQRHGFYRQKYDVRYCVVSYRSKNMEKDTMVVSIEVKT